MVVVLAVATLTAAWWRAPLPVAIVIGTGLLFVALRRPTLLVVAAAAAASVLGVRAWDGVERAPTSGNVAAGATVVADPVRVLGSVRLELRLDEGGRRVQATAAGDAGAVLASRLAGERVRVEGRLGRVSESSRAYLARRHIGSRLTVVTAHVGGAGHPVDRFANQLRRTLIAGTDSMSFERRALFTGLVLGDDREQQAEEIDDFRAAGLTHLLAVSGQNVAFALAVAAPLLRRLDLRRRFVVGLLVLLTFGVLTRWEPSVLRAVGMAALSLTASTIGRPASSLRILGLAVTGLVLIDPMLAGSIGFLLSVGACSGIAVVAPALERRRVPTTLAVTIAAQVGVAPVLVPVFGGIPLASFPANLLAVPAAGPVMMWGLIGGVPAGLLGGRAAWLLHLPTRLLLAWISGVARVAANLPLPEIGPRSALLLAALAAAVALIVTGTNRRQRVVASVGHLALLAVVFVSLAPLARPSEPEHDTGRTLATGAQLWRADGAVVLVVAGNADAGRLLGGMRRAGVRRVDVLVLRSGGSAGARLAAAVRHRALVRTVLAPPGHQVPDAEVVVPDAPVGVGGLEIVVVGRRKPLDVRVGSPRHAPRARAPPLRRDHARPRDGDPQPDARLILRPGPVLRPG